LQRADGSNFNRNKVAIRAGANRRLPLPFCRAEAEKFLALDWKMVGTLQIAVAGTVIGIILSMHFALLVARGAIAGPLSTAE